MHQLPFTRDHPHLKSPPGALSADEIRYWLRHLLKTPPWKGHPMALAVALGLGCSEALKRKARDTCWVYPGEQVRLSRQIRRVLAGELVPVNIKGKVWRPAIASNPVPLVLPRRMRYNLARGRLEVAAPPGPPPTNRLPGFRDSMLKPIVWEPD